MTFFVYFFIFLSFMDFFAQLPIMSTYALNLGASEMFIGFIVGAYSFSNMFSNVISGQFVDQLGPKKVLTYGFVLNGLILFLYSIASTPNLLFIVRLAHGISAGLLVPAAFTFVSIMNRDGANKSGKKMAFSGAAVGIAAIMGPAFGGIVSKIAGSEWVFRLIGIPMIVSGLLTAFVFPNKKKESKTSAVPTRLFREYVLLFKKQGLLFAYFGALALMFSQGILAYMLPLKVAYLQLEDHISGLLMSTFGIIAILLFLLPTNKIFDWYKSEYLMIIGMGLISLSLIGLSFATKQHILFFIMGSYGAGFAFLFPSISALISRHSTREERGRAYGLFYGFFSLGSFAGSSITGALSMTPSEGFLTAASLLVVVSLLIGCILYVEKKKANRKTIGI
ncbi:MFS transporter [Fervidibacillus albus]|uniref:MFS transporter n=1 Tax=Fervidibacillus albus TaxID=2980026 RepID=A0A9E8RYU6_9BACI|nr:MFS transporter [Fervidibacillus albus]WAA11027.1 MFS transporter [Fervidibacillus albus]